MIVLNFFTLTTLEEGGIMDFLYSFIVVLAIGSGFIILGRLIKVKFIEWIGRAIGMLAIAVPIVSFFMGVIDGVK